MDDKTLPKSLGSDVLPPLVLPPKEEDLCRRLDDLYATYSLKARPSDMFRGAMFVMREEFRSNPDWMAQAAHSLREILYPFYTKEVKRTPTDKKEVLKTFGSARADSDASIDKLGRFMGQLTGLAHHGVVEKNNIDFSKFTPLDFERLISEFEKTIIDVLSRQLDVHNEIDALATIDPSLTEPAIN